MHSDLSFVIFRRMQKIRQLSMKYNKAILIVEICEDVIQILDETEKPHEKFRLWITTEVNKVR